MAELTEASRHLECPPTPELIAKNEGRIKYGGQGRMETASARIAIITPFDLLEDRGKFERDYRTLVARFALAYDSHCISLGAWSGKLGEGSYDIDAQMPSEALYRGLMRRIPQKKLETLQMLIAPIPDGEKIEKWASYLLPQVDYYASLLDMLSREMQAVSKEGICENGGGI